jgi:hypothetical protein
MTGQARRRRPFLAAGPCPGHASQPRHCHLTTIFLDHGVVAETAEAIGIPDYNPADC